MEKEKRYFAGKVKQEYADEICKKALELGIPEGHILFSKRGVDFLTTGVYIKFTDEDTFEKFKSWQIPGLIEEW